jgi:hypothetical protein
MEAVLGNTHARWQARWPSWTDCNMITGVTEQPSKAAIPFNKFHVVRHASSMDAMRRIEQKTAPALKGMR